MRSDQSRPPSRPGPSGAKQFDLAMLATFAGVFIVLVVSAMNMRELRRLGARVDQLETLTAPPAQQGPDPDKIYTIDSATAPTRGAETAPVTIAEFSEFQCPFCRRVEPTLKQIEETYKDRVRFVWKHLPLTSIHAHAMDAAIAAEAARRQGKFWEYHDKLFANQERLESADLKRYAQELGLDMARFGQDFQDPELKKKVETDMAEADALSLNTTPSFFINGRYFRGARPYEAFAKVIDEELTKRGVPVPARVPSE